jgi:hypothetical protein
VKYLLDPLPRPGDARGRPIQLSAIQDSDPVRVKGGREKEGDALEPDALLDTYELGTNRARLVLLWALVCAERTKEHG